ncbi:hypothetical protein HPB50_009738 [Hyalomma asiaticum]|uniref:Uncharacterized protein n=1 Tax=Hyalomma asiaticum TaxID=266040 RepID=A0ACB7TFK8_HYAAI|nr:hypothetical protein HPB50_009738 [Hyalomma asiaticum]
MSSHSSSTSSSSSSDVDDDFVQAGIAAVLDVANHFQFDPLASSSSGSEANTDSETSSASGNEDEFNEDPRVGNVEWCQCGRCTAMDTGLESVCCREIGRIDALRAILHHSPNKPVLIFVSSRRQTRLTALDLIAFLAAEDNPRQWLHMPDHRQKRKPKEIALEVKSLLKDHSNSQKVSALVGKYGLSQSTVSTIIHSTNKLTESGFNGIDSGNRKKVRQGAHKEVEDALFEWFLDTHAMSMPISRPMLAAKAKQFAYMLHETNFEPGGGWIQQSSAHGVPASVSPLQQRRRGLNFASAYEPPKFEDTNAAVKHDRHHDGRNDAAVTSATRTETERLN